MSMKQSVPPVSELGYEVFPFRTENREYWNVAYTIDGRPLLSDQANWGVVGAFSIADDKESRHILKQLLRVNRKAKKSGCRTYSQKPVRQAGRVPLYLCSCCGDIGCGALCVRISSHENSVMWSDFAIEDGMSSPFEMPQLGSFRFDMSKYKRAVEAMYAAAQMHCSRNQLR